VSSPAIVLDLARALPGWEIRLGMLQPEGPLSRPAMVRLSARDERNSLAVLTIHSEWVTLGYGSDPSPSLLRGLLLHGGLSEDEAKAVRALLPGGGL